MENNKHQSLISLIFDTNSVVNNKTKYTILQWGCAIVHFMLIFVFAFAGVYPLVAFNIVSTVIYILCGQLIKNEKYIMLYYITFIEICLHSYTATILVGWAPGFPLYILAIMPVIFYMHFSLNTNTSMKETFMIGLIAMMTFVTCKLISQRTEPVYPMDTEYSMWIYIFNSICTFTMLLFFSMLFLREMQCAHKTLEDQNARLDRIAGVDALTGLYNRRSMDKFLEKAAESKQVYSLIMCDIDDFKKVNDTYGHDAGDMVLKSIADAIIDDLRDGDYVCRWGGEEILILATETSLTAASKIAERVRKRIEGSENIYQENVIKCTVTFGAAESSEGKSAADIINLADSRLYKGKKSGKNCVVSS